MEKCANCERAIGNLEEMFVWHDRGVCAKCLKKLQKEQPLAAAELPAATLEAGGISHFYTKVVGVTFRNEDGSRRQRIIQDCHPGERLKLVTGHEPKYPQAVAVFRENGRQIGHISAEVAASMWQELNREYRFEARVTAVTGGYGEEPIFGVNLLIIKYPPVATAEDEQEFLQKHFAEFRREMAHQPEEVAPSGKLLAKAIIGLAILAVIFIVIVIALGRRP